MATRENGYGMRTMSNLDDMREIENGGMASRGHRRRRGERLLARRVACSTIWPERRALSTSRPNTWLEGVHRFVWRLCNESRCSGHRFVTSSSLALVDYSS